MIRRNPHVFGDVKAETVEEVVENWERIKAAEKSTQEIPWALPSLILARKLLQKGRRAGVPSPQSDGTLGGDLLAVIARGIGENREDEDAEAALRMALRRYVENI
jgi:XTP/dITP diphosphohydrolase